MEAWEVEPSDRVVVRPWPGPPVATGGRVGAVDEYNHRRQVIHGFR